MAVAVPKSVEPVEQMEDACFDEVALAFGQLRALESAVRSGVLGLLQLPTLSDGVRDDGACSLTDWVTQKAGISPAEAREMVTVAESLKALPFVAAAFAEGGLSWRQLCLIVRLATADNDAFWAEEGHSYSVAQLKEALREKDAVDPCDPKDAFEKRRIFFKPHKAEMRFHGTVPLDSGLVLRTALQRIADETGAFEAETNQFKGCAKTHADALIELASRNLGADSDPDRATVLVEITAEALADPEGFGRVGDTFMPSAVIRRLTCDSRIQGLTFDKSQPVGVGRMSRSFPGWLRKLIKKRDRGCRFPMCWRTEWIDAHHIEHWADGGPSDLENALSLCRVHHHYVHDRGWSVLGNPNESITFVDPGGRTYEGGPPPLTAETWNAFTRMLHEEGIALFPVAEVQELPKAVPDG